MSITIMIDSSIKRNRKFGFELQSSRVIEKHYINYYIIIIIHFLFVCFLSIFHRSVIGHSIIHRVLLEYLTHADENARLVCTYCKLF